MRSGDLVLAWGAAVLTALELARFVDGQVRLKHVKHVTGKSFACVDQAWIFALTHARRALGCLRPTDDQILLRVAVEAPASDELLESRPFLRETTEDALRAELGRLRAMLEEGK